MYIEEVLAEEPTHTQTVRQHKGTTVNTRLVFDLGMNNGDDSAYYLLKGYEVVAVEANPTLVDQARVRFQKEIQAGLIVIEHVGIADQCGYFPFWVNDERSVFSSLDPARAARNGMRCHRIELQCLTLDTLLEKYGVPYYLKIDVEGAESSCLKSLVSFPRPYYISVEAEKIEYLQLLWQLGYRQFAIIDQMRHNSRFPDFSNENLCSKTLKKSCNYVDRFWNRFGRVEFPRGSSGPIAHETDAGWQTFEETAYNWLHLYFGYFNRGSLNRSSWYDFHARRAPTEDLA
jgi:FkbM family methyltransferase